MADSPDTLMKEFVDAFVAGDLDAIVDLYDEDATYAVSSMEIVAHGRDEIRKAYEGLLAMGKVIGMDIESRDVLESGDLAATHMTGTLHLRFAGADEDMAMPIRGTEVMRKGADGQWRYVIDDV
jgi:uncharacterized protein (TIGR02246 family)